MSTKLVAVCGATGRQGGGVLKALQSMGGFKVRALTRNPEGSSAQALAGPDVEVVKADFDDPTSLRAAFSGVDAVFAVTDFWQACGLSADRELQQGKNLVDAAKEAGVKHFVWSTLEDTRPALPSREPLDASGRTVPHFDGKAEIANYAQEQLPGRCTMVCTSIFFENLLPGGGMDPAKQQDGSFLLALPVGKAMLAWCSTPDIGKAVAAVIAGGPDKFGDKEVSVNSDELSLEEVAATFTKVFGKQVTAVAPPADDWVQMVIGFGVPETAAKDLGNMFLFFDTVDMRGVRPRGVTRQLVPQAQTLEAWLTANKDKFGQQFA